jgi:hypothetical protein
VRAAAVVAVMHGVMAHGVVTSHTRLGGRGRQRDHHCGGENDQLL